MSNVSVLKVLGSEDLVKNDALKNRQINYLVASDKPFVLSRFLVECGNKLNAKVMTIATAQKLFHKFHRASTYDKTYDLYLVASACLYLAGKVEDNDYLKLRDIINVVYTTLHRNKEPLPLDSEYYNIREAIVEAELFLLRMIGFQTRCNHPHKYLLHYLKSLRDWMPEETWSKYPIAKTSWSLLQDSYHDQTLTLDTDPSDLSLACIQLSLQTYGVQVPLTSESSDHKSWYKMFDSRTFKDKIWEIVTRLMDVYNHEGVVISPTVEDTCSSSSNRAAVK